MNHRSSLRKLDATINRSTYTQATVRCSQRSPGPDRWLIAVVKNMLGSNRRWYFVVDSGAQLQFDIPLNFVAGNKYKVSVKALAESGSDAINSMSCYRVIGEGDAHFRAGARYCFLSLLLSSVTCSLPLTYVCLIIVLTELYIRYLVYLIRTICSS